MSGSKRLLEETEELRGKAYQLLLETGAIEECQFHDYVYFSTDNSDAEKKAYAIGTNMFKNGEVAGGRVEFMDTIKRILDEAAWDCPACGSNRES